MLMGISGETVVRGTLLASCDVATHDRTPVNARSFGCPALDVGTESFHARAVAIDALAVPRVHRMFTGRVED